MIQVDYCTFWRQQENSSKLNQIKMFYSDDGRADYITELHTKIAQRYRGRNVMNEEAESQTEVTSRRGIGELHNLFICLSHSWQKRTRATEPQSKSKCVSVKHTSQLLHPIFTAPKDEEINRSTDIVTCLVLIKYILNGTMDLYYYGIQYILLESVIVIKDDDILWEQYN